MKINQLRLKRTAGILKVVFDVFFWAAVAIGVIGLLFFIATYFIPDSTFAVSRTQGGSLGITLDGMISFRIDPELYEGLSLKPFLQAVLPMLAVIVAMLAVVMNQVGRILKTVTQEKPFDRRNATRLLIVGAVLMSGSIIFRFVEGRAARVIIDMLGLNNINIIYSADGTLLLTGFLVLILAGVFQYGSYLQEEYDVTL